MVRFTSCFLLLALVSSCAEKNVQQDPPPFADFWQVGGAAKNAPEAKSLAASQAISGDDDTQVDPNKVAAGFLFEISHPEDQSLRGKYRVGIDGIILLPYHVEVRAAGLDLKEFQAKVVQAYRPYFKDGTPVSVALVQRKYWLDVRGLISKPGKYMVDRETSLDELIAQAGGLGAGAQKDERSDIFVRVQRSGASRLIDLSAYYQSGDVNMSPKWHGGEVVFFQQGSSSTNDSEGAIPPITILGAVNKPGEITYKADKDLFYYLSQAGGQSPQSDMNHVEIVRKWEGKNYTTTFDSGQVSQMPLILPGDVLIIGKDHATAFEKFVTTAGSIAGIISAVAILIFVL